MDWITTPQVVVSAVGAVFALVGIIRFCQTSEVKGDSAQAQTPVLSVTGPPGLVLALVGALMMIFPFTAWWPKESPGDPAPLSATATPSDPTPSSVASPTPSSVASPTASHIGVAPMSFSEALERVGSGVVRIETTTCEPGLPPSGSGFMVGEDLVATVAHVVEGARTVSLRTAQGVIRGEVLGVDQAREVAVVRTIRSLGGSILKFAPEPPGVTDEVAILGYPQGKPLTTNRAAISALGRRVEFENRSLTGLIQIDAAVNPGNSGGPIINPAGEVVGLVEAKSGEGLAYAVPAADAEELIDGWSESPVVQPLEACPDPTAHLILVESQHADAPALARTFFGFVDGINGGDYESSWLLQTGQLRGAYGDYDSFVEAHSTSHISDFVLERVNMNDETTDIADVRFTSTQEPRLGPDGQRCSQWNLRYTLRMDSGLWLIDAATSLGGTPTSCDPASGEALTPDATPTAQGN